VTKINPLYIIALLLVACVYSFVMVRNLEQDLQISQHNFYTTKAKAQEFDAYNSSYASTKAQALISELEKMRGVSMSQTNTRWIFVLQNNHQASQELLNKVLNSFLIIALVSIDEKQTRIEIEKI